MHGILQINHTTQQNRHRNQTEALEQKKTQDTSGSSTETFQNTDFLAPATGLHPDGSRNATEDTEQEEAGQNHLLQIIFLNIRSTVLDEVLIGIYATHIVISHLQILIGPLTEICQKLIRINIITQTENDSLCITCIPFLKLNLLRRNIHIDLNRKQGGDHRFVRYSQ